MTRPRIRRPVPASARRALTTVTIGIVLVSLGVLAGAGPAIGDQTAATTLGYTCQFPSGAQQVQMVVNATFPETGAVDAPITPTNVSVKLDLPQAALGDLTKLNAASVTATGDLSVVVKHNASSLTTTWPGLTAPSTPLPTTGNLTVTMAGTVPPTSEANPGDVTFAADAFGLVLTPLTTAGTATTPATVTTACTLNANQTPTLATVVIPSAPTTTSGPPAPNSATPPTAPNVSAVGPRKHGAKPMDLPTDPACNLPNGTAIPGDGSQVIAALDNRTNLNKLNESSAVSGTVTLTNIGLWFSNDFTISVICYSGQLDLPPSSTTILGFGFIPITTTLTYQQDTTIPMEVHAATNASPQYPDGHPTGHASAAVYIRVSSASINGVPLDVGSDCGTATSVPIVLDNLPSLDANNNEIYPYNGVSGGYLQGSVDIPRFQHCGVGENLDSLLSAPVAGPGNLIRACQGTTVPIPPGGPPPIPPPPDLADNHCQAP
jgi:hypothetical protein